MPEDRVGELLREAYEAGKLSAYFDRNKTGQADRRQPEARLPQVPPTHEGWHH